HLALPVSYDQESSQDKSQLFNENELQSESDHSISLSDNDDSEIYEEDKETIKESNEESQFTDLKSEQEEVIVHPINKPKGNGSLKFCLSTH
ncbi:15224_t:CDS:2, partial [Gigaspora margarita]